MIKLTTNNISDLRTIFKVLSSLNSDECELQFDKTGISIDLIDRAQIRMIQVRITHTEFLSYHVDTDKETIRIKTDNITNILKQIPDKNCDLTIEQTDSSTIIITAKSKKISVYQLRLLEISEEEALRKPKLTFTSIITTTTEDFIDSLNNLVFTKDSFIIKTTPEYYELLDEEQKQTTLMSFTRIPKSSSTTIEQTDPTVTSKYNKSLVSDVLMPLKESSSILKISYANEYPAEFKTRFGKCNISIIVAPRVNKTD